jgi:hypothetical protein
MNLKMNSCLLAIILTSLLALSAAAFNQSNDGLQPPSSDIRSLTAALRTLTMSGAHDCLLEAFGNFPTLEGSTLHFRTS